MADSQLAEGASGIEFGSAGTLEGKRHIRTVSRALCEWLSVPSSLAPHQAGRSIAD